MITKKSTVTSDNAPSVEQWNTRLALFLVLISALAMRVWGLDFGLPHIWARPDESRLVNMAVKFGQGDLKPPFLNYPTLYPYSLAVIYGVYYLLGKLFGLFPSLYDFVMEFAANPSRFYLISRILSATAGTATAAVVYYTVRDLFDRRTALVSSVFMAMAYLHARDSHFGVTDVTATFFVMMSFLWIVKVLRTGKTSHYVLAGIMAGLAASTKYIGFLMAIPMVAAHLSADPQRRTNAGKVLLNRRPWLFLLAMIAAFIAGTPYALLSLPIFLRDFSYEISHLGEGHMGIVGDRGWWHHLRFTLYYGLGWPMLLAALAGLVVIFRKSPVKAAVLCSFPLIYYLWAGSGYTVFARYMIPVTPFVCILAAYAIVSSHAFMRQRLPRSAASVLAALLAIAVISPSAYRTIVFDHLVTKKDSRLVATEWINKNIPAGASIYQLNSGGGALQLRPGQYFLEKYARYDRQISEGFSGDGVRSVVERVRDSLSNASRYRLWTFDSDSGEFVFEHSAQNNSPDYIITEYLPVRQYFTIPDKIARLIAEKYQLYKTIEAFDTTASNAYDPQDHFYVPFAGSKGVTRPGPNIYIYKRLISGDSMTR